MGLSRPLFGLIFPLTLYVVRLQMMNFTRANDDRKQERITLIENARHLA